MEAGGPIVDRCPCPVRKDSGAGKSWRGAEITSYILRPDILFEMDEKSHLSDVFLFNQRRFGIIPDRLSFCRNSHGSRFAALVYSVAQWLTLTTINPYGTPCNQREDYRADNQKQPWFHYPIYPHLLKTRSSKMIPKLIPTNSNSTVGRSTRKIASKKLVSCLCV